MEREVRVVEESLLHLEMELTVAHLRIHLQRVMQEVEGVLTEEEEVEAEVEN